MLRPIILFVSIVAMIFILAQPIAVIAQSTSENVHKETTEAWDAIKAYMVDKKHEAFAHGKELLHKADARIEELEGEAAKASGDTKAQYQKEIKDLKKKRANAAKKLDELEKSSASTWDSAKHGFAEAYKDLLDAYHEAAKKFN